MLRSWRMRGEGWAGGSDDDSENDSEEIKALKVFVFIHNRSLRSLSVALSIGSSPLPQEPPRFIKAIRCHVFSIPPSIWQAGDRQPPPAQHRAGVHHTRRRHQHPPLISVNASDHLFG